MDERIRNCAARRSTVSLKRKRRTIGIVICALLQAAAQHRVVAWNVPNLSPTVRSWNNHANLPSRGRFKHVRSSSMRPLFVSTQSPTPNSVGKSQSQGDPGKPQQRFKHGQRKKGPMNNGSIKFLFREAKALERKGLWIEALAGYNRILERAPKDAHSHLALARLEARRETKKFMSQSEMKKTSLPSDLESTRAQMAFAKGTEACPDSVHLWQAWAVYEEASGNIARARELFEEALALEPQNPYVCHAFGLYEKRLGNIDRAMQLFRAALESNSTAALVCSLGEILISKGYIAEARDLYGTHLNHLRKEKDLIEVYLAAAWLEEKHFENYQGALELLELALDLSPTSSLANVALARLEGRMQHRNQNSHAAQQAIAKRLAKACAEIEKGPRLPSDQSDGRIFNALAQIEVKRKQFQRAREVLQRGMKLYPFDSTLLQASGKVEERLGNITGARSLYGESLRLEPSAPTLVSFALLELNNPRQEQANFTYVRDLFEEALILDPRHGAAYNAYGNAEYEAGNIVEARRVFQRGLQANCSDIASLYHGFGKVELSLGNVEKARDILEIGLNEVRSKGVATDSTNRDRTKFLSHTLGMLELNLNRPTTALETFQEGIERCGNSSRLLLGAALSEMKLGKDDAARELFEKSVLSDERHAQAWQAWGVMETKAGNFKTASALFQCGIRNVPSYGPLWHGFALLEQKKDEIHNARVLYASGLQKAPRSVALYQGWAQLELRQGNYIDARKLITEALTRNKKNGHCWLVAAGIEEESGNGGLVSLILRRGIECAPNDAELYRKLGDYLVGKGKVEDAREVFEKGMELNPMYAPLYHSLAELEARVFNLEALSKLNRRAAELFHTNALEPPKYSSEAFATKIRAKRTRAIPEGIAVLAEKIVEEFDDGRLLSIDDIGKVDPSVALESLSGSLMEDEFVGDLLQDD